MILMVAVLPFSARANEEHSILLERPEPTSGLAGHLHLGWESLYVSEGRDNLDGDGLVGATLELAWESLVFGAWLVDSPGQSYDEMHLNIAFVQAWGDFEFYAMYNHLRFFNDSMHDHEVGVGGAWSGVPWEIVLGVDAYYSFDASGAFIEVFAEREFAIGECLTLAPGIVMGFNQGYVADGHHGPNHISARLGADYELFDGWFLEAHASYSWALGREVLRPDDALLRDFGHFGAGVRWEF